MIKIGVAGALSRIGTTTQAIQLVKAAKNEGKKVVYVEYNKKDYLSQVLKLYSTAKNQKKKIQISGIDMIKKEYAKDINKRLCDIAVFDFGNMDRRDFPLEDFLDCQHRIIVCGIKPNEIFKLEVLLQKREFNDDWFLFSFIPKGEEVIVTSYMGSLKNHVLFTDTIYDPFQNSESSLIFKKIFLSSHNN